MRSMQYCCKIARHSTESSLSQCRYLQTTLQAAHEVSRGKCSAVNCVSCCGCRLFLLLLLQTGRNQTDANGLTYCRPLACQSMQHNASVSSNNNNNKRLVGCQSGVEHPRIESWPICLATRIKWLIDRGGRLLRGDWLDSDARSCVCRVRSEVVSSPGWWSWVHGVFAGDIALHAYQIKFNA
jgi:hypothetical protein